jgi:hypothetical protein
MPSEKTEIELTLPTALRVLHPSGQVEEMKLETYLAGAVAAEIGADAPLEALKAQAIASRTYVVAAKRHPDHNADVCTAAHCQKWKRVDPVTAPEVFRALSETWAMVAMHDGQLISAFFFEHCDGRTRNAEDMHIPALAYLRGVDCSCGFLTLKGHGVGMCKRGAIVMARRGASFEQILQHYYRGITIVQTAPEMPAPEEHVESESPPLPVAPPVAPRPQPRTRKAPAPAAEPTGSPKPKRRATRRAAVRVVAEPPPPPPPVIEITAVPASVALKRIQLPPSVAAAEGAPAAKAEPTASAPAPSSEEKTAPPLQATAPTEPTAPGIEEMPAPPRAAAPTEPAAPSLDATPLLRRLPLDFPMRESTSVEPLAPPSPAPPAATWRLAQAEPIEPAREAPPQPAPAPTDDTPSMIARRIHVDHLPGARMICGALPRPAIVVMIEDPHGENTIVYSGTAPQYGEGGFETALAEDGKYIVTIGGRGIEIEMQGDTVFIHA